jgi:hypothetical protein
MTNVGFINILITIYEWKNRPKLRFADVLSLPNMFFPVGYISLYVTGFNVVFFWVRSID